MTLFRNGFIRKPCFSWCVPSHICVCVCYYHPSTSTPQSRWPFLVIHFIHTFPLECKITSTIYSGRYHRLCCSYPPPKKKILACMLPNTIFKPKSLDNSWDKTTKILHEKNSNNKMFLLTLLWKLIILNVHTMSLQFLVLWFSYSVQSNSLSNLIYNKQNQSLARYKNNVENP